MDTMTAMTNSCHIHYMAVPVINIVETGKNIDRLRKENNLSIRELAELLGFTTPQAVYKWIHGKICLPWTT